MLIDFDTPPSYEIDANVSRSRAGIFYGSAQKVIELLTQLAHPSGMTCVRSLTYSFAARQLSKHTPTPTGKEETRQPHQTPISPKPDWKNQLPTYFFFQVVDRFS